MKKIFFALCVVLALVGCKKTNEPTTPDPGTTDTVKTFNYKGLTFDQLYSVLSPDDAYEIFRVRGYIGNYYLNCGDAALSEVNLTATFDTASTSDDWQNCVDNFEKGNWYHIYDQVVEGDTIKMGMFCDTIIPVKQFVCPSEVKWDSKDGFSMSGSESGILVLYDFVMQNGIYLFTGGSRTIVDDVTKAGRQFVQTGGKAVPCPGYVQCGHFDADNYRKAYTLFLSGSEVDFSKYPYYGANDSYLTYLSKGTDGGKEVINASDLGYINSAKSADEESFYILVTAEGDKLESYNFTATMFKNCTKYGLSYKDGKYEVDANNQYVMGPTETVTYTKTKSEETQRRTRELPVRRSVMEKQMSVNQTILAVLRMAVNH